MPTRALEAPAGAQRTARHLLLFVTLLAAVITLQWLGGAYASEFSGYADQPAHYVTGLMIRDYIASGFTTTPMAFAENYYIHYPKVAFGIWGPLLHVIEGGWMLLFTPSRVSIMLLMALITTALAFSLARVVGLEFGTWAGVAIGLALVSVGIVQSNTASVMADNLCALIEFLAVLCFGRYLDSPRRRDAVLFGLFACLSILTKGNGFALALVPPLAVLLTRRFGVLKRGDFWIPVGMVLMVVGPWQLFSEQMRYGIGERYVSWSIASAYGLTLLKIVGPWLLPFALAGFYDRVIRRFPARDVEGLWAAAAAMIAAFWVFHSLVPSAGAEPRYAVTVVAPLLMFFVAGLAWVAARMPPRRRPASIRVVALAVGSACVFAATSFAIPRKLSYGFAELADALTNRPELRNTAWLVSSEADGEGLLISEVAMRDHRPGHVLLRASKMLSQSDWDGTRYELLLPTPEETLAYLESVPVRLLIVDRNPGPSPVAHHRGLLKMLSLYPDHWQELATYPKNMPVTAAASRIEVYRLVGQEDRRPGEIEINLKYTLGRTIKR